MKYEILYTDKEYHDVAEINSITTNKGIIDEAVLNSFERNSKERKCLKLIVSLTYVNEI